MQISALLLLLLVCAIDIARPFAPPCRNRHRAVAPHRAAASDDGVNEEILLRMNLGINVGADPDASLEAVRSFARSFPFAAVLPVQILTYTPSEDGKGVRLTFLRKKTKEKGSVDGGIDFSADFATTMGDIDMGGKRIELVATRNSEGQTVSKIFSEKIVVLEFVKRIATGEELSPLVSVESVFHKWLA